MSLMGGGELTAGLVILVLAALVTLGLRRRGLRVGYPSALFLSLVPVSVLLFLILGVMLILHGLQLV